METLTKAKNNFLGFIKSNGRILIISAVLLALFAIMIFLTPYIHDDWPWGSEIGEDRLESWFDDYNGRYAGNLLVLLLTRSEFAQVAIVSLSLLAFCFVASLLIKKKSIGAIALSAFLLLTMPREIFVQGITWTSGYSNYFPPILITLFFLCAIRKSFDDETPNCTLKEHILGSVAFLIMGFIGSLFMENVTIYNVLLAASVVIFVLIKHKKIFPSHLCFLIGCVTGAICMFTNSAYSNVANDSDFYRSFLSLENLDMIFGHFDLIFTQLFCKAFPLIILISAACITLMIKKLGAEPSAEKKPVAAYALIIVNSISLVFLLAKGLFPAWNVVFANKNASIAIMTLLALAWCFSVLFMVIMGVADASTRAKMIFLLLSVPTVVAPLAVINPLNSRCLVPAYLLLSVFCVILIKYLAEHISIPDLAKKIAQAVLFCSVGALLTFYISIYSSVREYEMLRIEYLEKQIDAGYEDELICSRLPYSGGEYFVYTDKPINKNWEGRFKSFYKLETKASIKFVSPEEFDKWRAEFDAKLQD